MYIRILVLGRGIEGGRLELKSRQCVWKWRKTIAKELEEYIACSIST